MSTAIALIALVLSIAALIVAVATYVRRERFERLSIRQRLTDAVQKLSELNARIAKCRALPSSEKAALTPQHIPWLEEQRRLRALEADRLIDETRDPVDSFEYVVVGNAFGEMEDRKRADWYFGKARETKDPVEYCVASRNYARFLFNAGEHDAGREWFRNAIESVSGQTDREIAQKADTYVQWADTAGGWGFSDERRELLEGAKQIYDRLGRETRRVEEIGKVDEAIWDLEE